MHNALLGNGHNKAVQNMKEAHGGETLGGCEE